MLLTKATLLLAQLRLQIEDLRTNPHRGAASLAYKPIGFVRKSSICKRTKTLTKATLLYAQLCPQSGFVHKVVLRTRLLRVLANRSTAYGCAAGGAASLAYLLRFAEQPVGFVCTQIEDLQAKLCVLACSAKLSKQPVGFVRQSFTVHAQQKY